MYRQLTRAASLVVVLVALAVVPPVAFTQSSSAPPLRFNPRDQIPFDRATHEATLPNGLKYFVRQNGRPEKRVALRLVVKSGSIEEADDQQGLAHFIEHMAFNGSASSPVRSSRRSSRLAHASGRTSTPTPASTRRCTCSTCPATRRPSSPTD
jgi:hypothetical protein